MFDESHEVAGSILAKLTPAQRAIAAASFDDACRVLADRGMTPDEVGMQVRDNAAEALHDAARRVLRPVRFSLRRVPLNNGGYDSYGSYFGQGAPLYAYESEDGQAFGTLRARSRDLAKAQVLAVHPAARFYA